MFKGIVKQDRTKNDTFYTENGIPCIVNYKPNVIG